MRSLQCARAAAALLVVYYHAVLQVPHLGDMDATPLLPLFGKSGVDIFFVLSGLLIWSSTREGTQSVATFYRKRFLRIAPLYWLLTLAAAGAALLIPFALRSTRFDAAHVAASLLFVPWPNPASSGSPQDLMTPPIVPGWTLNFEVFFYLVFGLCLPVPPRFRLPAALLLFGMAALAVRVLGPESVIVGFYDPGLIAEFVLGLCLGRALEAGIGVPTASAWLLLFGAADCLVLLDWQGLGLHRLVASGLPAALLLFSLAVLDRKERWPRLGWLVALGDATYSIYLTHVFVLAGFRMLLGRLDATIETQASQIAYAGLAIAACVAAGLATYRYVEQPLGRMLRDRGLRPKARLAAGALAGRPAGR